MQNAELLRRVEAILEAGRSSATTGSGRSQIDSFIVCTQGYSEPGYSDPASGIIVFGNFNTVSRYDGKTFVAIDEAPARVAKLLEKLGIELEWSDEWACCDQCGKGVRTKPDSYSWQPSHTSTDNGITCHECVEEDPTDYLQSLEGDSSRCVTMDLDLESHGYKLLSDDFENGLYGGQSDRPELIAKALLEQGITRFIFRLDGTRQFDMSFSVWVHEEEFSLIDMQQFEEAPTTGPDPAVQLQKALADANVKMASVVGGIKIAKCDIDNSSARVRSVTPEEFVAGTVLDF